MNTPLYTLRCIQIGLRLSDLDVLDYGFVIDLFTETDNDDYSYQETSQPKFHKHFPLYIKSLESYQILQDFATVIPQFLR